MVTAAAEEPPKIVYVIPLRDEVEPSMVYLVRRGVKEAEEKKADALILDMDTNGGRADSMEEIVEAIGHFSHQDQTYTFVNTKAFSAGAFIASGTRHIYMAPGSVIGAATPVMLGSGGGVEQLPESYEKKISSAFQALGRANAEKNGHNPKVFDAMVDRESGLTVEGVEILPKGKVLTLTNTEAEKPYGKPPKPLLSDGTIKDLDALVQLAGGDHAEVLRLAPTGFESIARFFTAISPYLMTLGIILGYLEFKSGSFGILAVLAGLCFLVFFFGQYIAGLSGYEPIVFFLLGLALIALEVHFLPGLFFPTLLGLALVVGAILLSMVDRYPTDPVLPTIHQLHRPLQNFSLTIGLSALGILLIARFFPQRWAAKGLQEATVIGPGLPSAVGIKPGATGEALTMLRPAGTAQFGEELVDVVSDGRLIEKGTPVRIEKIEGSRVVVTPTL